MHVRICVLCMYACDYVGQELSHLPLELRCIHIRMCNCEYVCVYVCMYVCPYVYRFVFLCVCMFVCMFICMRACA